MDTTRSDVGWSWAENDKIWGRAPRTDADAEIDGIGDQRDDAGGALAPAPGPVDEENSSSPTSTVITSLSIDGGSLPGGSSASNGGSPKTKVRYILDPEFEACRAESGLRYAIDYSMLLPATMPMCLASLGLTQGYIRATRMVHLLSLHAERSLPCRLPTDAAKHP